MFDPEYSGEFGFTYDHELNFRDLFTGPASPAGGLDFLSLFYQEKSEEEVDCPYKVRLRQPLVFKPGFGLKKRKREQ